MQAQPISHEPKAPNVPAKSVAPDTATVNGKTNGVNGHHKADRDAHLKSSWPVAMDLAGSNYPCRLEGEVADLVVRGEIPKEFDGYFYRVMTDPWAAPHPGVSSLSVFPAAILIDQHAERSDRWRWKYLCFPL